MTRKYRNTGSFIEESSAKHQGKYDYSKTVFTGVKNRVVIICPEHGEFKQVAMSHLCGHGCKDCGNKVRPSKFTNKSFIEKARLKHGDKYDYNLVNITGKRNEKVNIVCPTHGQFEQLTYSHIRGAGCRKCGRELTGKKAHKDTDWFIEKAKEIHGNTYDYSKTEYKGSETPLTIVCRKHGEWSVLPRTHFACSCPQCAVEDKIFPHQKTTEMFLKEAIEKHGNKFDYSETIYVSNSYKVKITCPDHGPFKQKPPVHLKGRGCPKCSAMYRTGSYSMSSATEYHKSNPGKLYHVRIEAPDGRVFDKVGITEREVDARFSAFARNGYKLLETVRVCEGTLYEMICLETIILESLKDDDRAYRVHDFRDIPAIGGWTECFLPITTNEGETE